MTELDLSNHGDRLTVADYWDLDDELPIDISDNQEVASMYLGRDDVIKLRDHLTEMLTKERR